MTILSFCPESIFVHGIPCRRESSNVTDEVLFVVSTTGASAETTTDWSALPICNCGLIVAVNPGVIVMFDCTSVLNPDIANVNSYVPGGNKSNK